jgi:hypothetical protein
MYLIDHCDNVGVWEVNIRIANVLIGYEYSIDTLTKVLSEKVTVFDDGARWWIKSFISFQHGYLDPDSTSKPILSYIALLKKHTLYKEYTNSTQGVQGKGKGKGKGKAEYTEAFDAFWEVYPAKKGKGGAFKSWKVAIKKADPSQIISAVLIQKEWSAWRKDGGRFIPHPQTWLNNEQWCDEDSVAIQPQAVRL